MMPFGQVVPTMAFPLEGTITANSHPDGCGISWPRMLPQALTLNAAPQLFDLLFFLTAFLVFVFKAVFAARLVAAALLFFLAIAVAISSPVMGSLDSEGDASKNSLNFSVLDFFGIILPLCYEMPACRTPAESVTPR